MCFSMFAVSSRSAAICADATTVFISIDSTCVVTLSDSQLCKGQPEGSNARFALVLRRMKSHFAGSCDVDIVIIQQGHLFGGQLEFSNDTQKILAVRFHRSDVAGVKLTVEKVAVPQCTGHVSRPMRFLIGGEAAGEAGFAQSLNCLSVRTSANDPPNSPRAIRAGCSTAKTSPMNSSTSDAFREPSNFSNAAREPTAGRWITPSASKRTASIFMPRHQALVADHLVLIDDRNLASKDVLHQESRLPTSCVDDTRRACATTRRRWSRDRGPYLFDGFPLHLEIDG
jgi:hypothetical protein